MDETNFLLAFNKSISTNFVNASWCYACSAFSLRILAHHNCLSSHGCHNTAVRELSNFYTHTWVSLRVHTSSTYRHSAFGRWLRSRSSTLLSADGKQTLSGQTRGSPSSGKSHVTFLDFSTFSIRRGSWTGCTTSPLSVDCARHTRTHSPPHTHPHTD